MIISRRAAFLGIIAAPAIVRASSLMPVKVLKPGFFLGIMRQWPSTDWKVETVHAWDRALDVEEIHYLFVSAPGRRLYGNLDTPLENLT